MTISARLRLITAFLLWLNLSGCAAGPALLPKGNLLSSDAAKERFIGAERAEGVFKAFAHIDIRKGKRRYITKCALLLKRPSFIKMENLPPMGPPDFFLSIADGTMKIFLPAKNRFYQGVASGENLARFFPFAIKPEDLTDAMLGIPPGLSNARVFMNADGKDKDARLDVFDEGGTRKLSLRMNREDDRLDGFDVFSPQGNILYVVVYNDYTKTGAGTLLPRKITITAPDDEASVSISYSDVELDPAADADLLYLPLPPGLEPVPLDRQGGHERNDD